MMTLEQAAVILMGYALGGVLFSYHIPRMLRGVDVTQVSEDGNPGTANAVRYAGAKVGMICLLADLMKGMLPVRLGMRLMEIDHPMFAVMMAAPVLGHATAPFYRMNGGKAIAVSFGVLAALLPVSHAMWMLAMLYIVFSTIVPIFPNERRTVATFGLFALWALLLEKKRQEALARGCILMALVVMWKNKKAPKKHGERMQIV